MQKLSESGKEYRERHAESGTSGESRDEQTAQTNRASQIKQLERQKSEIVPKKSFGVSVQTMSSEIIRVCAYFSVANLWEVPGSLGEISSLRAHDHHSDRSLLTTTNTEVTP